MKKLVIAMAAMVTLAGCTDPNNPTNSPKERPASKDGSNNSAPAAETGKGVDAAPVNGMTGATGQSKDPGTASGQSGEGTSRPEKPSR